jgi:hypothetical protein
VDPLTSRFKIIDHFLHDFTSHFLAWRQLLRNLIDYFEHYELMQKSRSKDFTKLSQILDTPVESHNFVPDGVSMIWKGLRENAANSSDFYQDQSNIINAGVVTDLIELQKTIKNALSDTEKEFSEGVEQISKGLEKFVCSLVYDCSADLQSDQSQSLGKWIPVAETNATSLDARHDPYIL